MVKQLQTDFMELYLESITAARESGDPAEATSQGNEGTELVLKYIYENFDVFKLIFCHSAGTEYERYFDELAEIEEKYYREFVKQFSRT